MFYKAFFLHHFVHTAGLLPFLVEIDLLRLIIHQCSGTHKPVLWISLSFINCIHLKQSCLKVHHMDSIEAYFKIILHTACIINVCDRDSRCCRCIKLYNTGNVPDNLCPKIQRPALAEDTASCRIQIYSVLIQDTGHTRVLKEQEDRRLVGISL